MSGRERSFTFDNTYFGQGFDNVTYPCPSLDVLESDRFLVEQIPDHLEYR